MATLIRVVRVVGRAVQKAHREQERQAKRIHAQKVRQEKANLRESIQIQKQREMVHRAQERVVRAQERAHRAQERHAKLVLANQALQEKERQNQLINRGKLALAARVEKRKQLKESVLNLKVNT